MLLLCQNTITNLNRHVKRFHVRRLKKTRCPAEGTDAPPLDYAKIGKKWKEREGQETRFGARCTAEFLRTDHLQAHMNTHQPLEDRRTHVCTWRNCGKAFVRSSNLERHRKTVHLKSKDFQCTHCEKKFTRKESLQAHLQKH